MVVVDGATAAEAKGKDSKTWTSSTQTGAIADGVAAGKSDNQASAQGGDKAKSSASGDVAIVKPTPKRKPQIALVSHSELLCVCGHACHPSILVVKSNKCFTTGIGDLQPLHATCTLTSSLQSSLSFST